jgi:phage tail sheath protein FI
MSVSVSYPGVYIQEIPSGVHTITGVATSIAAFVDTFSAGVMNKAIQLFSFADFERAFGGLSSNSEASYAIQQFFLNGGTQAYAVRVSSAGTGGSPPFAAAAAGIGVAAAATGTPTPVLVATAVNPGSAGNLVAIDIDYGMIQAPTSTNAPFNMTVTQFATVNGSTSPAATEVYQNLVLDPTQSNDARATVNAVSQLIILSNEVAGPPPAQTGTVSGPLTKTLPAMNAATSALAVSLNGTVVGTTAKLTAIPATLSGLAAALQTEIRKLPGLSNVTVSVVGSQSTKAWLVVKSGNNAAPGDVIGLADSGGSGIAAALGFASAGENVQHYALGGPVSKAQTFVPGATAAQSGHDGNWDPVNDGGGVAGALIGDPLAKTGMHALDDVDLFNILCIPATMNLADTDAAAVATAATALCTSRRAMYILDVPPEASPTHAPPQPPLPPGTTATRDTRPGIMAWLDLNATLRSRNAALYFPRMDIPDPLAGFRLRPVSPSGTMAGLWARTDGSRGVWKAPAGTEATLTGVQQLEYKTSDAENGVLNPLAINCLRTFPIYGPVSWGARTLFGADQMADDYKYIPVRRLALYIEESLYRGTQWAVFEPNDTPLWAQLRLSIGTFMQTLFRQGAFQGSTPQQAYFVVCDATTNPQSSINLGIVNVLVGFAPLKPAEFVVISIQQMAGQLGS